MEVKSLDDKRTEARYLDLGNSRREGGSPRQPGIRPIYHSRFGPYLLWLVTGRFNFTGLKCATTDEKDFLSEHFGSKPEEADVIPLLEDMIYRSDGALNFNPYRHLLCLLQAQNREVGNTSPSLATVEQWLKAKMDSAEAIAQAFHPVVYNVVRLYASPFGKPVVSRG